ncbi:MAG: aspartate dehydrogenase [Candidatus Odinarchaeia archaeon]
MNIGIIGCGAIGNIILEYYKEGILNPIKIVMLYDYNLEKVKKCLEKFKEDIKLAKDVNELIENPDISLILEAASQQAVKDYALKILENGKDIMIMSIGALVDKKLYDNLLEAAEKHNRKIYLPSGAIAGIDAIKSAQLGKIFEVELITRKPPSRFKNINIPKIGKLNDKLDKPLVIFEGNAKDAQSIFPRSINVAATLSLVSLGPEKTKVKIIADPTIDQNIHEIHVKGECGSITTIVNNIPSIKNPRTSYLAALSAVKTLKKIVEPIQIGT